ncbi:hypothetical protein FPCIR_13730 [Fusarium pseudocircinatum]|uniref:Uncharacterized protein n=1 Tax=Fusarium pseudocircinatum TaxID=56676 RepID=A0A8H5KKY6_9HYPO|nr:hypothetical protein FPCIR_13730 [Fusarium pseudocircinatum]
MEFNIIIVLISFLVGAVIASPLANRNRTEGLGERLKGTDLSRPEPADRYRNDPRFALGPSLFAAAAIRNSSFVARRIIQKRPDTEEYESKFNHICQSGKKTENEYKLPKPDDNIDVSFDKMEYSEHEKTLAEVLLKSLNKTLEKSEKKNPTGHTQIIENPKMMPYVWHDSLKSHTREDKDEDQEHKEDDSESESDSNSDDEEDAKKGIEKVFRMIQKRDDEKEEEEKKKKKKKKKPYLWPEQNRPKVSKDGKFRYLYSSEGKQYAVATPQHLANEVSKCIQLYANLYEYDADMRTLQTNRHEKAQQDREQKLDIVQHELQKEMDAKLQQEHSRLKHENEMKFQCVKARKGRTNCSTLVVLVN